MDFLFILPCFPCCIVSLFPVGHLGFCFLLIFLSMQASFFIFFIRFFDTVHHNIKNWVWICWSGQDSNSRRYRAACCRPNLVTGEQCLPGVANAILSKNTISGRENPFRNPVEVCYTSNHLTVLASR